MNNLLKFKKFEGFEFENNYPTLKEVKDASHDQLIEWYSKLRTYKTDHEKQISDLIKKRFVEGGGYETALRKTPKWKEWEKNKPGFLKSFESFNLSEESILEQEVDLKGKRKETSMLLAPEVINKDNFHLYTSGNFHAFCSCNDSVDKYQELLSNGAEEIYTSPVDKKGICHSKYLIHNDYLYRLSDHWGMVRHCFWRLDGGSPIIKNGYYLGRIKFKEFESIIKIKIRESINNSNYIKLLDQGRISKSDIIKIINSAGLEVPDSILNYEQSLEPIVEASSNLELIDDVILSVTDEYDLEKVDRISDSKSCYTIIISTPKKISISRYEIAFTFLKSKFNFSKKEEVISEVIKKMRKFGFNNRSKSEGYNEISYFITLKFDRRNKKLVGNGIIL